MSKSKTPAANTRNSENQPLVETIVKVTEKRFRPRAVSVQEDSEAADEIERYRRPPFYRRVSVAMTVWLTLVWIAVFGSFTPLVIVSGIVLAAIVQMVFPLPLQRNLWHIRISYLLVLVIRFIWDLVVAGSSVSVLAVTGKPHQDGIIRVDTRSGNPVYMTILAAMSSMVPGTIVVKLDPKDKAMYLHVLDLAAHGGIEGARKEAQDQEKRILLALAPNYVLRETGLRPVAGKVADALKGTNK